jgi:hypothetical protein
MAELSLNLIFILSLIGLGFMLSITLTRFFNYNLRLSFKDSYSVLLKNSFFSFFGIPLDIWINFYYGLVLIIISAIWLNIFPISGFLFFVLLFGLFFFLYAVVIQVFVIKRIFKLVLFLSLIPFINLTVLFLFGPVNIFTVWIATFYTELFFIIKVFASIGFILSVFSFFTFLSFMDDLQISSWEAKILSSLSEGIWLSILGLLAFLVGVLRFNNMLTEIQILSLMLSIVLVTAVCEFIKMVRIRAGFVFLSVKKDKEKNSEKQLLKRLSFGVEGISLVSWLMIFIFFVLPVPEVFKVSNIAGIYLLLVLIAFLSSQFIKPNLYGSNKKT